MFTAERNNVPTFVAIAILLNMGSYLGLAIATIYRAVCWHCLATGIVLLPVIEPTTTIAGIVASSIDVTYFHIFNLLLSFSNIDRGRLSTKSPKAPLLYAAEARGGKWRTCGLFKKLSTVDGFPLLTGKGKIIGMMHSTQQQLLSLSQRYDLRKMGLRQIGRLIGVDHPQKVKFHMNKLGLLDEGKKPLARRIKSPLAGSIKGLLSIPILGLANCGDATMVAEARIEGTLPISKRLLPTSHTEGLYAVKAIGVSMNQASVNGKSIEDGDYVIVDGEDKNVKTGDYVLSIIGGLANIKRFTEDKTNKQIVLQSESTQYFPPIHIHEDDLDDYLVNGKVVEVIKQPKEDEYRYEPVGMVE